MADWRLAFVCLATVGAVVHSQTPTRHTHAGAIVKAHNGDPIPKAQAIAYAHQDVGARPPCPQHKEFLDRRESDARGNFEFSIDAKYATYYAVYCADGFQAKEVPVNDNLRSGTRVRPDPVRLYPSEATLKSENVLPVSAARQAITLVLDDVSGNLRYFRTVDGAGFAGATERLSGTDRELVVVLANRAVGGGGQPVSGAQPQVAQAAVLRVLNDATGNLRYYTAVAEGPITEAVKLFPPAEQAAIDRLRTRTPVLALQQ